MQIIEYVLIAAFLLIGSYAAYDYSVNSMDVSFTSQHDKMEYEKRKAGEILTVIEFLDSPLRIDILNKGENEITIKKLYVDGNLDVAYTVNGIQTNVIPLDEISVILPTDTNGQTVKIITENNNEYSFE